MRYLRLRRFICRILVHKYPKIPLKKNGRINLVDILTQIYEPCQRCGYIFSGPLIPPEFADYCMQLAEYPNSLYDLISNSTIEGENEK